MNLHTVWIGSWSSNSIKQTPQQNTKADTALRWETNEHAQRQKIKQRCTNEGYFWELNNWFLLELLIRIDDYIENQNTNSYKNDAILKAKKCETLDEGRIKKKLNGK
jgi:hypothetical protein